MVLTGVGLGGGALSVESNAGAGVRARGVMPVDARVGLFECCT